MSNTVKQENFLFGIWMTLIVILFLLVFQIRKINKEARIEMEAQVITSPAPVQKGMVIIEEFEAVDENGMTKTQRDNLDKFLNGSD